MELISKFLNSVYTALQWPIIETPKTRITLWSVVYLLVLVLVLLWLARRVQVWLTSGPLLRNRMGPGARQVTGTLARYLMLLVGLLAIVQTAGIDLTTFNVLAGAVGIGVGFGLQNVVSNFIAGVIIMFERPIKIGDRIVVGGVEGNVVEIGARGTTVVTNDNIAVIVPNSKFITEEVVNWKYTDSSVRFRIPLSVAYGSDARLVERVLLEIAQADPDVLKEPAPTVRFMGFGDDGLSIELRAWSTSLIDRKGKLISQLNLAIYERFQQEGINFPFPQRDLHFKSGVLELRRAPPRAED